VLEITQTISGQFNCCPDIVSEQLRKVEGICDLIYRSRSKSHIGSYEIIDFKDFNTL